MNLLDALSLNVFDPNDRKVSILDIMLKDESADKEAAPEWLTFCIDLLDKRVSKDFREHFIEIIGISQSYISKDLSKEILAFKKFLLNLLIGNVKITKEIAELATQAILINELESKYLVHEDTNKRKLDLIKDCKAFYEKNINNYKMEKEINDSQISEMARFSLYGEFGRYISDMIIIMVDVLNPDDDKEHEYDFIATVLFQIINKDHTSQELMTELNINRYLLKVNLKYANKTCDILDETIFFLKEEVKYYKKIAKTDSIIIFILVLLFVIISILFANK